MAVLQTNKKANISVKKNPKRSILLTWQAKFEHAKKQGANMLGYF